MTSEHRLTHIGLCVSDIARSTAFYCTALGFTKIGDMHVEDEASARLLAVPNLVLDLVYLERDGFRIELLGYTAPGSTAPGSTAQRDPRAMDAIGLTHLSFRSRDVDALAEAIVEHGGRLLADRTVRFDGGNRGLMLTDPDGNIIELIEHFSPREAG